MDTKLELDSSKNKNQKFKYLTTNMQNLLKNFNENLSPRKTDSSRIELLKKLKLQQPPQSARASNITRSKTISNRVDIPRPISQLDTYENMHENKYNLKARINRSQSQLNYNSLQRTCNMNENQVYENLEDKIRKTRSTQQIPLNSSKSSFITDSYNTDSDSNLSSRSSSSEDRNKKTIRRRSSASFIENPKSIVLRREKTFNDRDLPFMKQKLMASVKRGQSVLSDYKDQGLLNKINELQSRIFVLEIELDREKKKLVVEKEEKYELINEIKIRYENDKISALKALETRLNKEKLFELNKIKEMFEIERNNNFEDAKKQFENEIVNLKKKLRDKSEKCLQMEKLLKDEHSKSEKLFLKSIEMVRKYGSNKSPKENLKETQTDYSGDFICQKLNNIRQILLEESELNDLKNINIDEILSDIELRAKRLKHQYQNQNLEIKNLKDNKLKMESLYKIKCKSDLNKSAKIKKLEIDFQTELLKLRNDYNSDFIRYLEDKIVSKDSILNEIFHKLNQFLNNCTEQSETFDNNVDNSKEFIQNLINFILFNFNDSHFLNGDNLDVHKNVIVNLNLDNMYKKAPINLIHRNDLCDFKSNSVIKKIDHNQNELSLSSEKEKPGNKSIQDEIMELDKHLIDMQILSDSLVETQSKDKVHLIKKSKRADYKSSSNSSSCDLSNSSHSFVELEEASDLKFTEKPNISNLVSSKNFKRKPTIELIVQ